MVSPVVSIDRTNKKIDERHPMSSITFPAGIEYEGPDKVLTGTLPGTEQINIKGKMVFKNAMDTGVMIISKNPK